MRTRLSRLALIVTVLVTMATLASPGASANSIETPDPALDVGLHTSLALDANEHPVIAYYDRANRTLKLMHCNDPVCAGNDESITTPDPASSVGQFLSLTLDASGHPVISYHDDAGDDLKLMHCNDPNCAGNDESITSPDTTGSVGRWTSLALDSAGNPVVSYYDDTNFDLKVMHCNDPNCAGNDESITSPDTTGSVGTHSSLALDDSDSPIVAYHESTNDDLKVLRCDDPNCDGVGESITSPDTSGFVGRHTSLVLDDSGHPVVSYFDSTNNDLKLLHCAGKFCDDPADSVVTVESTGDLGVGSTLALSSDGFPVIAHYDTGNDDLKVVACGDPNCASAPSIQAPDVGGIVGIHASLALDSNDRPVVSYFDHDNEDLKVLRCANETCEPPRCNGLQPTVVLGAGGIPTPGADVIVGTDGDDVIDGLDGDDIICGRGGDDMILGGLGDDQIFGDGGNDTLLGQDDNDTIHGGNGQDSISGNAGDDIIFGGASKDAVFGGSGNDTIDGGGGSDDLGGSGDVDTITGGLGNDAINGGGGNDGLLSGGDGEDAVNGGGGNDANVHGDDDNDTVSGNGGRDVVFGDDGDDDVRGGQNDDTVNGGPGDDFVAGNGGTDTCDGGTTNEVAGDTSAGNCETVLNVP